MSGLANFEKSRVHVIGFITFMQYAREDWERQGKPWTPGKPKFHAQEHAKWIASWCQAKEEQDYNTTKEYAHQILNGTNWNMSTLQELKKWVEDHVEAECETGNLDDYLKTHWEDNT